MIFSVVAVMIWRLMITLDPSTNADFVYGLYLIGLVSFLELWLSIIIVSLPALAPLFRHYIEPLFSQKRPSAGNLQEAQNTFGSEPRKRTGPDYLYSDLGLAGGQYSAHVKTGVNSSQSDGDDTVGLVQDMQLHAISMRREVVVQEGRNNESLSDGV